MNSTRHKGSSTPAQIRRAQGIGDDQRAADRTGTFAALGAYAIWGFFPLYWRLVVAVEPLQILAHRIVWASLFCLVLLAARQRLGDLARLFTERKTLLTLCAVTIAITANWGIYIWAVNSGRVIESALGYFINPLVAIAFGMIFFRERADVWTRLAFAVAAAGIVLAALIYGSVPWISLSIAFSFSVYGALKKGLGLDPLLSLAVETLIASPVALVFLVFRGTAGFGAFSPDRPWTMLFLVLGGVVTAIPLLLFGVAANRISMQLLGFIQYLNPCIQLSIGVFLFDEKPSTPLLVALASVVVAVLMYLFTRKSRRS
jgi:chloramphenicol-sensitive protein RarD